MDLTMTFKSWIIAWTQWLDRRNESVRGKRPVSRPRRARLACELLEARIVPTLGNPLTMSQDLNFIADDEFGYSVAVSGNDVLVGAVGTKRLSGAGYLYEAASNLSAVAGNNQSTLVGTAYGTALEVQVTDALGNPISGASVTFTESNSVIGAGATFGGSTTIVSNAQGLAVAPVLTANDVAGKFTVTASVGNELSVQFNLTNSFPRLVFANVPHSVAPGQDFSFQVEIEDTNGSLLTGNDSAVSVSLVESGIIDIFEPVTITVQAVGGVATFTGNAVPNPGSYGLRANGNNLEPAVVSLAVTVESSLILPDPGNSAGDFFGNAVAMSGSYVLVGTDEINGGAGAAYLYSTSGQLLHTFQDPNNTAGDRFGYSVALSGGDVLVGTYELNGGGAAYLYNTSGNLLHTFQDPTKTAGDSFGYSVAMSGGDVLVGANNANGRAGAAYLYSTSGKLLHTFLNPKSTSEYVFGLSVAISGSDLLVGALGIGDFGQGVAYLYNTSGKLLHTFTDPNSVYAGLDGYGGTVALSGSYVLVGAAAESDSFLTKSAAYLYSTSGHLLHTFHAPNSTGHDGFGGALALSGSNILVGAAGINGAAGAAYLYNTSGQLLQTFLDPSNTGYDGFGGALALSGNNILVGAAGINGAAGSVYLYQPPSQLNALLGNNQSTVIGEAFDTALAVQITDHYHNPSQAGGIKVTFTIVPSGKVSGSFAGGKSKVTVTSNIDGIAAAPMLTANMHAGSFTVTATAPGLTEAVFTLTSTAAD
jgi:hypothetical protein